MRLDMQLVPSALGLVALSSAVSGFHQPLPFARRSVETGLDQGQSHKVEYATIPIDHNDSSVGTYQNRYWVNEEHYAPGGPVFLIDVGELPGETALEGRLFNSSSFYHEIMEEFHGMGIVWEHRYYGGSFPFPIQQDPAPEQMKYLTVNQALADIPYFAERFSRDNFKDIDLTPKGTPWIMIGGSYAGMRSAFARNEYPDTIYAAFAASAPVETRINMSVYNDQIYRGMIGNGLEACAKDAHAAMRYIDEQLSNDETAASIKQTFLGPGAENITNGDFARTFLYFTTSFQSYGVTYDQLGITDWCTYLETDPDTNRTAGPEGMAISRGERYVTERLASWPGFVLYVNDNNATNCKGLDETKPLSCEVWKPETHPDGISWYWQYCTELGYYQISNVGPHQLLPKLRDLEYEQEFCNRQFPTAVKSGQFPSEPQVDTMNAEHGGWTIRPSNVFWSAGEFDPWRTLTPLSTEDFAPKGVKLTTDIPKCGVETAQDTLFGYVLEGGVHAADVSSSARNDTVTRKSWDLFRSALHEWLPCFEGQSNGDSA